MPSNHSKVFLVILHYVACLVVSWAIMLMFIALKSKKALINKYCFHTH